MTRMGYFTMLLALIPGTYCAFAQEDEFSDTDVPSTRDHRGGIVGFGIGISGTWHLVNTKDLNAALSSDLTSLGLPELSSRGMFLLGGHGYAYIVVVPNLRIGGMGAGGSLQAQSQSHGVSRKTELEISFGAATIEYVIAFGRLHVTVGSLFGGGSRTLTLTIVPERGITWSTFPAAFEQRREYKNPFFSWQPQFGLEYEIHPLAVLSLAGGWMGSSGNSWRLNELVDMAEMPDFKFDAPYLRLGLTVGLFLPE